VTRAEAVAATLPRKIGGSIAASAGEQAASVALNAREADELSNRDTLVQPGMLNNGLRGVRSTRNTWQTTPLGQGRQAPMESAMLNPNSIATTRELKVYSKATMVKGQPALVDCVDICGQTYAIANGPVTVMGLEDDWFADVIDAEMVVDVLKESCGFKPDIFTFWQRPPDVEPEHSFYIEWEEIAVLPVKSYEYWWNHQIKARTRTQIRKAEKAGLVVKEVPYDDDFVRGMTAIFNETPVRQGRKFWHYGKDFDTVRRQFSRFIHRETMIGAYYEGELIGFIMMGDAQRYGVTSQIIAAIKHRDKSPNNALIAKAVELCERKQLPYLVYLFWSNDSLAEFKRRCGFERMRLPRYFVPLTQKGKLALKLGLHRGWKALLPRQLTRSLKTLSGHWHGFKRAE